MYCPKCKHTSFDHLTTCPKCGYDWQTMRTALNLGWLQSKGHEWLPESPSDQEKSTPYLAVDVVQAGSEPETAAVSNGTMTMQTEPPFLDQEDSFTFPEATATVGDPGSNVDRRGGQPETPPISPPPLHPNDSGKGTGRTVQTEDIEAGAAPESGQHAVDDPPDGSNEELPVWEIELPQDILPSDYFPDPGEKSVKARQEHPQPGAESTEMIGDIEYDFDDVEVIFPDGAENSRKDVQTMAPDSSPRRSKSDDADTLDELLDNLAPPTPGKKH